MANGTSAPTKTLSDEVESNPGSLAGQRKLENLDYLGSGLLTSLAIPRR